MAEKTHQYQAMKEAANFQIREALLEFFEPGSSLRTEFFDTIRDAVYRAVHDAELKRIGIGDDNGN